MGNWGSNDNESSKPNWLTEEQKKNCIRTIRGWEIPAMGSGYSGSPGFITRNAFSVCETELLVAMPLDRSATGGTHPNFTNRGLTSIAGSLNTDLTGNPNYSPYYTQPANSQTIVFPVGTTQAYLPVLVSDANWTDLPATLRVTGPTGIPSLHGTTLTITGVSAGNVDFAGRTGQRLYQFATAGSTTPQFSGVFGRMQLPSGAGGTGLATVYALVETPLNMSFSSFTGFVSFSETGSNKYIVGATGASFVAFTASLITQITAGTDSLGFTFPLGLSGGRRPYGGWGGLTEGAGALKLDWVPNAPPAVYTDLTLTVFDTNARTINKTGSSNFTIRLG